MGVVGGEKIKFIYKTYEKTDTKTCLKFLRYIFRTIKRKHKLEDCVIVLDNHSAHGSNKVKDLFKEKGVLYCYLPVYSSALNPSKHFDFFKDLNQIFVS